MQEAGNRRFVALTAKEGNQIQQRRSFGVIAAPLGLRQIVGGAPWPGASQRRQQQQAIRSYRQGRLARHRLLATHLSLAHSQNVFLVAMIYFDLPAIKAGLHQQLTGSGQIGREEVSRLTIVSTRVARELIRHWSDHQQSQASLTSAALPHHTADFFEFDDAALAAKVNPGLGPETLWLLAHLLGSEKLLRIFAALAGGSGKAKPRILTAARQQVSTLQSGLEHRSVGEAAVTHAQQRVSAAAALVQTGAQTAQQSKCLLREIFLLAQLQILFVLFLTGTLARLLQQRCFLKANGNTARRIIALLIMWEQQRGLQETQPIEQIYMEGRRKRIALPTGIRDLLAGLAQFGVVNGRHHWPLGIALQILIDYRIEQALRLPTTAREHLIIRAPVAVAAAQCSQRARNGAAPEDAERSNGVFYGALTAAGLRECQLPTPLQERVKLLQQYHYSPPFRAKTFLSVRTKRSPRLTFLTSVETIDSRSSLKPCNFSTRSMISVTWSGLPARRSTSCTMPICDVPLRAALGCWGGPERSRLTALNWASSETSKARNTALSISFFSMTSSSVGGGPFKFAEDAITEVRMSIATVTYVLLMSKLQSPPRWGGERGEGFCQRPSKIGRAHV